MLSGVALLSNPFDFFTACPLGLPVEGFGSVEVPFTLQSFQPMTARRLWPWR